MAKTATKPSRAHSRKDRIPCIGQASQLVHGTLGWKKPKPILRVNATTLTIDLAHNPRLTWMKFVEVIENPEHADAVFHVALSSSARAEPTDYARLCSSKPTAPQ
jgi:hypothetical protein